MEDFYRALTLLTTTPLFPAAIAGLVVGSGGGTGDAFMPASNALTTSAQL